MIKVVSGKQYNDLEKAMDLVNIYGINMNYTDDLKKTNKIMNFMSSEVRTQLNECNQRYNVDPLNPRYIESSGLLRPVKSFLKKLIRKGIGWYIIQLFNDQNMFNSSIAKVLNEHNKMIDKDSTFDVSHVQKQSEYSFPDDFYCKFEDKFNPESSEVKKRNKEFIDILKDKQIIIDCGCGNGLLLRALYDAGKKHSFGVDNNPKMVQRVRKKGLNAICSNANIYLSRLRCDSTDAIVSTHMIEYLDKDSLYGFMKLSFDKLNAHGILIIETYNPLSVGIFGYEMYNKPKNMNPVHPVMLKYLAEYIGFQVDQMSLSGPFLNDCLFDENVQDPIAKKNIQKLNNQMYGARNYTLICHKP